MSMPEIIKVFQIFCCSAYIVFCAVLLCVFTFWVACCDVRYDFRIKTMFSSSLPPVVCRRTYVYLCYLCLFVYSDVQYILYCVLFFFVLCTLCWQFLWIVPFFIVPSVFSNVYLCKQWKISKHKRYHVPVYLLPHATIYRKWVYINLHISVRNKMNCELMLTYDTPALRQTGSRNLTGQKTLPTIWGTYMKLVTKYQICVIDSCWEKCDEKCAYMFNVYKNQLSRQTGSRNLTGPKTLPTIWHIYMKLGTKYQIYAIDSCWEKCDKKYLGRTEGRTEVKQYTPLLLRGAGV
jgi:hypothetical protein